MFEETCLPGFKHCTIYMCIEISHDSPKICTIFNVFTNQLNNFKLKNILISEGT
jgi:hypothetical protein